MSFLVVDGNFAEHRWLAHVVIPPGADLWIENELRDGLDMAVRLKPAVVVLASYVRGIDAIPLVNYFRAASGGQVVVTTHEPDPTTEQRACNEGAFSCVSKIDALLLRSILVVARLRARPPVQAVLSGATARPVHSPVSPALLRPRRRRAPGR